MAVGSRAIKAGEAFVSMMLDDEEFANAIEEWEGKFQKAARSIRPLTVALGGLGAAMVAPFAAGLRNLLGFGRQVDFSAQRLGVMSGEFARFTAIAKLTGVELDALEVGMKTIGERIIQLKAGSGETMMAFERVFGKDGIQAFLDEPNMMKRMIMIADALKDVGDAGEQSGLVLRLLGEAGNRLLPFLRLEDLESLAEGMERIFGNDDVFLAARELGIAFDLMKLSLMSASLELGAALVPSLLEFIRVTTNIVIGIKDWIRENQGLAETLFWIGIGITAVAGAFALLELPILFGSLRSVQIAFVGVTKAAQFLLPLLVEIEIGVWGVSASLTTLGSVLSLVGIGLVGFFASMQLVVGEGSLLDNFSILVGELVASFWDLMAVLGLVDREWAALESRRLRDIVDEIASKAYEPNLVDAVGSESSTGAAGTGPTPLITSSVASAFASQRTLGFSADVTEESSANERTANNTEAMAKNTRELIDILSRVVGTK